MEITLEKIELVKDRTGVSYREAKSALEEADGSVVDAIIIIEETIKADEPEGRGCTVTSCLRASRRQRRKATCPASSSRRATRFL